MSKKPQKPRKLNEKQEEAWREMREKIERTSTKGGYSQAAIDFTKEVCLHAFALPSEGQTTAIAIGKEKTASLFYDRVWSPLAAFVPQEIHFFGASPEEQRAVADLFNLAEETYRTGRASTAALTLQGRDQYRMSVSNDNSDKKPENEPPITHSLTKFTDITQLFLDADALRDFYRKHFSERVYIRYQVDENGKWRLHKAHHFSRDLVDGFHNLYGLRPTTIHNSQSQRDAVYGIGDDRVLVTILDNVLFPVEKSLSWEQVLTFRQDTESKQKCIKLLRWLDQNMVGKSNAFITDHICLKLSDYEAALRKHGITTALATTAGTFSAAGIPTILEHITRQPIWMSIAEGVLIGGATIAKVAEHYIDTKPTPADEIAVVYELKKVLR